MASIGPQLPPHLRKSKKECVPEDDAETGDAKNENAKNEEAKQKSYGPALPPGFTTKSCEKKVFGPVLPSNTNYLMEETNDEECEDTAIIGPCLPGGNDNLTDEERIQKEFEDRAQAMKKKLTGEDDTDKPVQRESWMLELPPELSKNFGLGPRSFRTKAPELGDRSVWTDTPADREKRKKERKERAEVGEKRKEPTHVLSTEEIELQKRVEEYNKATRPQSLMEMHQEKRKKTDEPKVRRPFDRNVDLAINRTDPKEKEKFIQNAKGLNSKFSAGKHSNQFL